MSTPSDVDSAQRRELMRHKLNDAQLEYAEGKSLPFRIRLAEHGRVSATIRLKIRGEKYYRNIYYHLSEEDQDSSELSIETSWTSTRLEVRHPYVWALAKHRAAEGMLGVRDLHKAATRAKRKRASKKIEEADA